MPNKKAKKRKFDRKRRREAIKKWKRSKKNAKKLSEMTRVERTKYWKDKYRDTPNGYWVAMLIGSEYVSDISLISTAQRKKNKDRLKR